MNTMRNWAVQAVEKLDKEKSGVSGQKEKVMMPAVCTVLKDFSMQDEEFAQAVVQGGTLADCMKQVAAGVGNSISDIDAYKKAVQFYFPGAEIKVQMSIDLIGKARGTDPVPDVPKSNGLLLNLEDFF